MSKSNLKNDTRLDDLRSQVREYGRDAAQGRDAKPKLALALVRAAFDNVIGPDDAESIYNEYAMAESKKSIHDHSAGGIKANVSKLRQIISLGHLPAVDGVVLLDKVTDMRAELRAQEQKLKGAFDTFVDIARAQLKSPDTELDDDQIRDLCVKGETAPKDLIQKLAEDYKRIYKRIEELTEQGINSASAEAAMHALGDQLSELGGDLPPVTKEAKAKANFIARAKSMGMSVVAH